MQVIQYEVQYSAGLLCVDSLLLMNLDATGTNGQTHTAGGSEAASFILLHRCVGRARVLANRNATG
jgi:hypothetical protein